MNHEKDAFHGVSMTEKRPGREICQVLFLCFFLTPILTPVFPSETIENHRKPLCKTRTNGRYKKSEAFIFKASEVVCPAGFEPVTFRVGVFMDGRKKHRKINDYRGREKKLTPVLTTLPDGCVRESGRKDAARPGRQRRQCGKPGHDHKRGGSSFHQRDRARAWPA